MPLETSGSSGDQNGFTAVPLTDSIEGLLWIGRLLRFDSNLESLKPSSELKSSLGLILFWSSKA